MARKSKIQILRNEDVDFNAATNQTVLSKGEQLFVVDANTSSGNPTDILFVGDGASAIAKLYRDGRYFSQSTEKHYTNINQLFDEYDSEHIYGVGDIAWKIVTSGSASGAIVAKCAVSGTNNWDITNGQDGTNWKSVGQDGITMIDVAIALGKVYGTQLARPASISCQITTAFGQYYSNLIPDAGFSLGVLEMVICNSISRCFARYTALSGNSETGSCKMWYGEFQYSGSQYVWSGWREVIDNQSDQTIGGQKTFTGNIIGTIGIKNINANYSDTPQPASVCGVHIVGNNGIDIAHIDSEIASAENNIQLWLKNKVDSNAHLRFSAGASNTWKFRPAGVAANNIDLGDQNNQWSNLYLNGNIANGATKRAAIDNVIRAGNEIVASNISIGQCASASGTNSVALGSDAHATTNNAVQLGNGTNSNANTLYFGNGTWNREIVDSNGNINANYSNVASLANVATSVNWGGITDLTDPDYGPGYISIGQGSDTGSSIYGPIAIGVCACCIDNIATILHTNSIAIGTNAKTTCSSIAIGENAWSTGYDFGNVISSIAIGNNATASMGGSIAIGNGANCSLAGGVCIGNNTRSSGVAIGSNIIGSQGVAIGAGTRSYSMGSVVISGAINSNATGGKVYDIDEEPYDCIAILGRIGGKLTHDSVQLGCWSSQLNTSNTFRFLDRVVVDSSGSITANSLSNGSDIRIKQNISDANTSMCLNNVNSLKVHRFEYKDFVGDQYDVHKIGWIADEIEKIYPKSVRKEDHTFIKRDENGNDIFKEVVDKDGNTKMVKCEKTIKDFKTITFHMDAVPVLWGAVQELSKQVEELKEELACLKNNKE